MRVLFVCRGNVCRSRFAEAQIQTLTWSGADRGDHEPRSAGVDPHPGVRSVTGRDVTWADVICVMEEEQEAYLRVHWPAQAEKVRVLGIPDVYKPFDPALHERLAEVVRALQAETSDPEPSAPQEHALQAERPHEHHCAFCDATWRHGSRCTRPPSAYCPWCTLRPDETPLSTVSRGSHFHRCPRCHQRSRHDEPCDVPTVSDRLGCPECDAVERTPFVRGRTLAFAGVGVAVLLVGMLLAPSWQSLDRARQSVDGAQAQLQARIEDAAEWASGVLAQARPDWGALQTRLNRASEWASGVLSHTPRNWLARAPRSPEPRSSTDPGPVLEGPSPRSRPDDGSLGSALPEGSRDPPGSTDSWPRRGDTLNRSLRPSRSNRPPCPGSPR